MMTQHRIGFWCYRPTQWSSKSGKCGKALNHSSQWVESWEQTEEEKEVGGVPRFAGMVDSSIEKVWLPALHENRGSAYPMSCVTEGRGLDVLRLVKKTHWCSWFRIKVGRETGVAICSEALEQWLCSFVRSQWLPWLPAATQWHWGKSVSWSSSTTEHAGIQCIASM